MWNGSDLEAPYSLRGVVQRLRPRSGYPAVIPQPLYLYAEYYGESGELDVCVDLVRILMDDDGDVTDEVEEACYGPYSLTLHPGRFVQGRSYVLRALPLPEWGVYELRLRVAGVEAPLISERLHAEG